MSSSENFYHYLPVDDLAMRWGSYSTGVGRGAIPPGKSYPPRVYPSLYDFEWGRGRTLPEFQLILITGGQGVFESRQTGIVRFESASLPVPFPGVWHRYRPDPKTGWLERWFGFNGDIAHRLIRRRLLCPENAVRKSDRPATGGEFRPAPESDPRRSSGSFRPSIDAFDDGSGRHDRTGRREIGVLRRQGRVGGGRRRRRPRRSGGATDMDAKPPRPIGDGASHRSWR